MALQVRGNEVPVTDLPQSAPVGNEVPASDLPSTDLSPSEQQANAAQAHEEAVQAKYGGPGQQALAAIEGTGKGLLGPIAAGSAKLMRKGASALGVPEEDLNLIAPSPEALRGREEANPATEIGGTVVGLMSPVGQGALLGKAGEAAAAHIVGEGVLKGMSRGAVKLAAENALYQSGDEVTKMINEDPNQTVGSAISNVGLAALIGGGAGAMLGSVSPLWKAANGSKVGDMVSGFKARMQEHLGVPEVPETPAPPEGGVYDPFLKQHIPEGVNPKDVFTSPIKVKESVEAEGPSPTNINYEKINAARNFGGKLADTFIKRAEEVMTTGPGALLGAKLGRITGIPFGGELGAVMGERMLNPFFKSIMPGIGKSILGKVVSPEGFKAASDYGNAVLKGIRTSNDAVKSIFSAGSKMIIPESTRPSAETREKLNTALEQYQQDPTRIAHIGGDIGHYMPDHAVAIGAMASNLINFLNGIKPKTSPQAPLDPPSKVSKAVQAQYNRALDIAQQPLITLEHIKKGTLTSYDVIALHTMYPKLYASLQQKITTYMVEHVAKGETVPYETRLGLSLFLQQALDSTMKPASIMAAQPAPQQNPQQPQQAPNGKKMTQGAANNMLKGSKSMRTQVQASEAMHSTGAKA